jgi:4-hydroxyproline epimerase
MAKRRFFCIDAHTCGNPVRLVASGGPLLQGATMGEKRLWFLQHRDDIRKGLMFEPRGHDMMSGAILYPPSDDRHDAAILFIETSGCLPMCGHGTIGAVTIALEEGLVHPATEGLLRLETPAGTVTARYTREGQRIASVCITNVPSFLVEQDLQVAVPGLGTVRLDVAYGGNFYAIVDPQPGFPGIQDCRADDLIRWGRELRRALNERHSFLHPEDAAIRGLSHVQWTGKPLHAGSTARNAVFYGEKAIDRSPCGTGTSARMAQWHARGWLRPGEPFVHESIIGSVFTGTIAGTTTVAGLQAIIPTVEGWARVTGYNHILLDEDDPYVTGFQIV